MDYSKYTQEELIKYIEELQEQLKNEKYGLYWNKAIEKEKVIVKCIENVPFLTRDKKKTLILGQTNNIIIEGDNFHALTSLCMEGKVLADIIYIDPPYNTGHSDFTYNDKFVDEEDGYRHSKWLNFMFSRLNLARTLLSEDGYIFISINEIELANLTLLCNEVFGEQNFIASCFVLDNLKGKTNDNFITSVGSRLLVYAKNKCKSNSCFNETENVFGAKVESKYSSQDNIGFYNLVTFKKTGQSKKREDRPYMFYPILEKDGELFSISKEEFEKIYNPIKKEFDDNYMFILKQKYTEFNFILPIDSDGNYLRWTSGFDTFLRKMNDEIIFDCGVKQKVRPDANEMLQEYSSGTAKSFMYKPNYSTGTDDLKKVIGDTGFDFPKPIELMFDILKLVPNKNAIILDFFAGSGTTGQAVLELNKEDGGHRQFILCTNNENNICTDVTYPRLKTVITGIRPDGSKYSDGIHANLIYYKTDFIPDSKNTDQAKYCLVEKVDELLCISEDIFINQSRNDYSSHYVSNDKKRHMFIYSDYFDNEKFNKFKEEVLSVEGEKTVYMFSLDNTIDETLFDTDSGVELKPIPSKIYEIYKEIVESIKRGE